MFNNNGHKCRKCGGSLSLEVDQDYPAVVSEVCNTCGCDQDVFKDHSKLIRQRNRFPVGAAFEGHHNFNLGNGCHDFPNCFECPFDPDDCRYDEIINRRNRKWKAKMRELVSAK